MFKGKEDDVEYESNPAEQNQEGIKENDGDKNNNVTGDYFSFSKCSYGKIQAQN